MSRTLSLYLARQFLVAVLAAYGVLLGVILLIDTGELLRRAANKPDASFGAIFGLALLHLPTLGAQALPFAVLFGAIFALVRLTRAHELAVVRAAGVSVWQFLAPGVIAVLALGVVDVTVLNPLAALMQTAHERGVGRYITQQPSIMQVSSTGLWLREADAAGDHSVVHAASVDPVALRLNDVTVLRFKGEDEFIARIDAEHATLVDGAWTFEDAWLTAPGRVGERVAALGVPTVLSPGHLRESLTSPDTVSFWQLPRFIAVLEATGLSALGHRMQWHSLLARPFVLVAMLLIAAAASLRLTRRGGVTSLVLAGITIGFAFILLSNVIEALGLGERLPVMLAAWTPASVMLMLGLAMLMHLEDG
jgi:lipopolysaccharide export system permease protein